MTPAQKEAVEAVNKAGSKNGAARALGISRTALRDRLRSIDPAVMSGMQAIKTDLVPQTLWVKTKATETEPAYSVMLRPAAETAESIAETIRAVFEGMEPAAPVIPPEHVAADLCNVFMLFDLHFGMRAWGQETRSVDYDVDLAKSDLKAAFEAVLQITPCAQEAVLILGGDTLHADDNRAETPAHKHKLDVDGRHYRVLSEAVEVMGYVIDRIRARHKRTTVVVLRGNHDEHSHLALHMGLAQRFRLDRGVTVEPSLDGLFMKQWGRAAIFAHHGDKAPPERQALYLSDVCPFWSETRHRHYYTGHIHKDTARDIGPVKWESLRAFCPPDAYAASMGYASRRALRADTFHKSKGRVLTAIDPIERAA